MGYRAGRRFSLEALPTTSKFLSERDCSSTRHAIGRPRGANKSEREKSGGCAPTVTGLLKVSDLAACGSSGLGQVPLHRAQRKLVPDRGSGGAQKHTGRGAMLSQSLA